MEEIKQTLQEILKNMVTKEDLAKQDLEIKSIKQELKGMASKDDLKNFATKDDLKNFATKDDLKNFATKDDLKNFATKDDLKNFATKDDLKKFATKDDLKKFATKEDLEKMASKEDLNSLRKELLDQLFVFEKEYGDKISSIYDFVLLQNDKYEKRAKDYSELENRVTRVEANYFGHERRISLLEMKKN